METFKKMGFEVKKEEVYSSSYVAAQYLKKIGFEKKAYLLGEDAMACEMKEAGIEYLIHQNPDPNLEASSIKQVDERVGAVVVGMYKTNYFRLAYAFLCLQKVKKMDFISQQKLST